MRPEDLARILSKENERGLRSDLDVLDERELELFSILGQGYSPGQIESEFGFDRRQLAALKQRIRKKLGLKDDLALLRLAAKSAQG